MAKIRYVDNNSNLWLVFPLFFKLLFRLTQEFFNWKDQDNSVNSSMKNAVLERIGVL